MLNETAIAALKSELRGELIEPNDTRYDAARKVYNAMIDRKPRLIARCADVADVIAAVKFARENKLPLSIRGGGHNAAGNHAHGIGIFSFGDVAYDCPFTGFSA